MFRLFRYFAKTYVDNIVIFSKTLTNYVSYLHSVFNLLNIKKVILSSKKSFLRFSIVILLDQKVDAFEFIAIVEKIIVIQKLKFSHKLVDLKLYLKLTNWLRNYISFYAQKAKLLQRRKILLLRFSSFNKNRVRKTYCQRTILKVFIEKKLKIYRQLQKIFDRVKFLIHFDKKRTFYIDIDTFKQREFEIIIYHFKNKIDSKKSKRFDIEFILFLSNLLNIVESHYWLTKLKIIELIWVVQRIKHMIKTTFTKITIIFIDHVANSSITRKITLLFNSFNKLNFRLIQVLIYLSQFNFNVKYWSNKMHVIFDALFKLSTIKKVDNDSNSSSTLNLNIFHFEIKNLKQHNAYVYQRILIKIFFDFKKKVIENYQKKKIWTNLIAMLTNLNNKLSQEINVFKKMKIDIVFKLHKKLIYYIENNFDKLCISKFLKKKIFRLVHDSNQHVNVYKNYFKIVDTLYISRFLRKIRVYIKHYFVC